MARRKQRKPTHLGCPRDIASSLQNGICSSSEAEGDEHVCGKCRAEFLTLSDFLIHKKLCVSKRPVLVAPLEGSLDIDEEDEDDLEDQLSPPMLDAARHPLMTQEWLLENRTSLHSLLLQTCRNSGTNVTLEELENTSVAVAQHGQLGEVPLKEVLSTFQERQVESLQLLKSLYKIILKDPSVFPPPLIGTAALSRPQINNNAQVVVSASAPTSCIMAAYPQGGRTQDSPGLSLPPPETNNLALLEKQAERYLQDSMARRSFLLNGLDEDRSKKGKPDDPASRHKCHFCGKILGSDSALQIHLRSHTGEKPFRCTVCGSCFSTRGNLKVHCQRHKDMQMPQTIPNDAPHKQPEIPSESRVENPPLLFPSDMASAEDVSKIEQALDFSTPVNGRKSPQGEINSRSMSPNDNSNFTDNSMDGSSDENMTADNYSDLKIDVERFDDDDRDNSNCMDDDESEIASSQQSFGTSPNFAPYFLTSPYENFRSSTPQVVPGSSSQTANNNGASNNDVADTILQDPNYYQDLLPKIGSNDNSWESLIEVTKTSETSKLQQLVDNIEHKLIEPNQCIICHRVLSCKSALQMHYRTHTGERPFRCKLCNRSFTTKGNLKTHMGVHRTKTPQRMMHQCPVCHRQFPTTAILQQHIRSHTVDPSMPLPPVFHPCDDRPPTLLPPSYPRQFLVQQHLVNSEPLALTSSKGQEESKSEPSSPTGESVIKATSSDNIPQENCVSPALSPRSCSSRSSNTDETPTDKEQKLPILNLAQTLPENLMKDNGSSPNSSFKMSSPLSEKDDHIGVNGQANEKSSPKGEHEEHENAQSPKREIDNRTPIDSREKSPPKFSSQSNHSIMVSLASDRPLPMTLPSDCPIPFSVHGVDRHYPPISIPNCNNDYTASLAALENHVKAINSNVTHPLPFPPHFGLGLNMPSYFRDYSYPQKSSPTASKNGSDLSADDRSTPGGVSTSTKLDQTKPVHSSASQKTESTNGGALDLTPRSSPAFQRPAPTDLKMFQPLTGLPFGPPHHRLSTTCRVCYKTFACNSALEIHYRSHTKERPFRCEVCDRGFSTKGNMRQHMLTHKIRDFPPQAFSTNNSSSPSTGAPKVEAGGEKSPKKQEEPAKRPTPDPSAPPPKRNPGQPKHMCQVCHKPFSSGSALQIHMRTHTGDKPFQCHICHRAFTTKGNLKVHMGTHMWNNSTSRRGRRMSLDLGPLQLTPGGKPGDFAQTPYFPYLTPFMNGLPPHQQPPKMNEISVIQTAGMTNGVGCNAPPATTSSTTVPPQQPLALLTTPCKDRDLSLHQNQNLPQVKDSPSPAGQEIPASWPWKISCNVCSKICSSSTELELHIRNNHCKKDSAESDRVD